MYAAICRSDLMHEMRVCVRACVCVYRRFGELFFDRAFITSSCSVDGGSDRMSVDVDKWRSLSDTAANGQGRNK